jgi:hypothetical protein
MNHYEGITPDQRWRNDLLNEMRQIRQLLERNAQAVEQPEEKAEPKRRGRRKGA